MAQTTLRPLNAAWDPSLETADTDEFCWTPLQLAARTGDVTTVRRILQEDSSSANEPPRGYYGQTALQAAAMHGHAEAVQLLVDAGADLHFSGGNNLQRSALQLACGNGDERIVDILLAAGARVDELTTAQTGRVGQSSRSRIVVTRYNGRTALQAACDRGHINLARRLIELGADVNAPPSPTAGLTAIQAAAGGGYLRIVELLLEHGADANAAAAKYKGFTALQGASKGCHVDVVKRLLREDVDIHAVGGFYGDGMALHAAAEGGNIEIIKMLLAAGAEVNACSVRGRGHSALQSAVAGGHVEAAQALRDAGATGKYGGGCFLFP